MSDVTYMTYVVIVLHYRSVILTQALYVNRPRVSTKAQHQLKILFCHANTLVVCLPVIGHDL